MSEKAGADDSSDMTVATIRKIEKQPNAAIIAELERLMGMARQGELIGLILTGELTGNRITTFGDFRDGLTALGHLARQMALVNRGLDNAKDAPE